MFSSLPGRVLRDATCPLLYGGVIQGAGAAARDNRSSHELTRQALNSRRFFPVSGSQATTLYQSVARQQDDGADHREQKAHQKSGSVEISTVIDLAILQKCAADEAAD